MSEEEAMIAGILDDPDDDLRRLVYCDWLQDRGLERPLEGFIRGQIEAAATGGRSPRVPLAVAAEYEGVLGCGVRQTHRAESLKCAFVETVPPDANHVGFTACGYARIKFVRGFADAIEAPLYRLVGGPCPACVGGGACPNAACDFGRTPPRLPGLLSRSPIRAVVVTDRWPLWMRGSDGGSAYTWSDRASGGGAVGHSEIPFEIFRSPHISGDAGECKGFPSPQLASAALSLAVADWARPSGGDR